MKLPAGEVVASAEPLQQAAFFNLLNDLEKRSFNGYVAWLGEGYDGLEEGVVLFSNGQIVAASYEHLKYKHVIDGKDALEPAANVILSRHPVYSVVSLTPPKVNLVLAFNDKAKLPKPIRANQFISFVPKAYSPEWAKSIIKALPASDIERVRALAKYGLAGMRVDEI